MSKDLEEFLRQSAEIRHRKMAQRHAEADEQAQQARSRSRPYTNAWQERATDSGEDYYDDNFDDDVLDERDVEILDAVHILEDAPINHASESASSKPSAHAPMPDAQIVDPHQRNPQPPQPSPADSLRAMIRRPDGLRQAFLIREILSRPRY